MRLRRKRFRLRAWRKSRALTSVADRTAQIGAGDILVFACLRNERVRLPWFVDYYRKLGAAHFLIVDNGSDDGSGAWLAAQSDVSLWQTEASYKRARFGMDWMNALLSRYGDGHWCLTVDIDELFVFPFCDTRPLAALTDWLDESGVRSFSAMLLDLYPKGPIDAVPYEEGADPVETACWFDPMNYTISRNPDYHNLWIQGGPRARAFFADKPEQAPSLNKIPLVKWRRPYAYLHSTHMLLPRGLNLTYHEAGGAKACGALLHTKFLSTLADKVAEELTRNQHFAGGREYRAYRDGAGTALWTPWSERYINWRQLEILGLISKGTWA